MNKFEISNLKFEIYICPFIKNNISEILMEHGSSVNPIKGAGDQKRFLCAGILYLDIPPDLI
jgi:hypothetical protein